MEKRDNQFFSELKRMNEDLISYLKETQDSSPYYDFTPTLEDYIKQFKELDKKYPEKNSSTFPSLNSVSSLPTTTSLTNSITTTAPSLFSFTGATNSTPLFQFGTSTNNVFASQPLPTTNTTLTTTSNNIFGQPPTISQPFAATNNHNNDDTNTNNDGDGSDDEAPPAEPVIDQYDEPDSRYSVKCKLYEKGRTADGDITMNLLGVGQLFIKSMDDPNKRQVIFRQDPDLRRVLVNEVLTPTIPVKTLPKAVQMVFPTASGGMKHYIAKLKDETSASNLLEHLKF